jgi:drug/metabolite transporter (DMT)-like permease
MMAGVAFAPASVAAVLLATSPIFSLFVERLAGGPPITVRAFLGTMVAVSGVSLLTLAEA